ncbi:hypothetical protein ABZ208_33385 [Streptomyces sp. NPDC006208]|uniref:hypothetical protein n=1 Tax=Streptomyces sp. NPDC006208 TaxID=3156734 RepID=UPI00339EA72B
MNQPQVRRATCLFGLAAALLTLVEVPLYFLHSGAPPASNVLTRILLSLFVCASLLVFLSGLRQLLRQASGPAYEWLVTVAFAAAFLYVGVTLVAHALQAGVVFGADGTPVDPTTEGPLADAATLLYGSVGRVLTALFLAAVGHLVLRTAALPRWAGFSAYVVAAVNLAFVPSLFFGTDPADFYSAVGWGTTAVIASLQMYWVLAVSVRLRA